MLIEMRILTILSSALILIGCSTIAGEGSETKLPLQELFESAPAFDQKRICSTGYLMISENLAAYPTERQATDERYQKAAILLFESSSEPTAGLADLQEVAFCGVVDLQERCWEPEGGQTFCVPFSKPIHIRVESFNTAVH
jgi:hypothetical protein